MWKQLNWRMENLLLSVKHLKDDPELLLLNAFPSLPGEEAAALTCYCLGELLVVSFLLFRIERAVQITVAWQ